MSEILTKSAMVRVLFEIVSYSKKEMFGKSRPTIRVKKVDVFPLAFVYSEDCLVDNYSLISNALHQDAHKLMDNLPECDAGIYELVGQFYGKFSLQDQNLVNQIWEVQDVKAYQLTEEEIQLLPPPLRPELDEQA